MKRSPSIKNGWISQFSQGCHCTSLKKTAVKSAIRRIFFHPAKFDNFKDEKISDYKTVSVAQSKILLD
jgi:hypothetical protein